MKRQPWTQEEKQNLRALFDTMPLDELQRTHFPNRSPQAVRQKAHEIGVAKRDNPRSPEALARLHRRYIDRLETRARKV